MKTPIAKISYKIKEFITAHQEQKIQNAFLGDQKVGSENSTYSQTLDYQNDVLTAWLESIDGKTEPEEKQEALLALPTQDYNQIKTEVEDKQGKGKSSAIS